MECNALDLLIQDAPIQLLITSYYLKTHLYLQRKATLFLLIQPRFLVLKQSIPAILEYGTRQFQARFERMRAPHGTNLIIGRDRMPHLGLGITGIPPQSLEAELDPPVMEERGHAVDGSTPMSFNRKLWDNLLNMLKKIF